MIACGKKLCKLVIMLDSECAKKYAPVFCVIETCKCDTFFATGSNYSAVRSFGVVSLLSVKEKGSPWPPHFAFCSYSRSRDYGLGVI